MTGARAAGADSVCLREATVLDDDGATVVIEREVRVGELFAGWVTRSPSARCWSLRATNLVPAFSASREPGLLTGEGPRPSARRRVVDGQ